MITCKRSQTDYNDLVDELMVTAKPSSQNKSQGPQSKKIPAIADYALDDETETESSGAEPEHIIELPPRQACFANIQQTYSLETDSEYNAPKP